MCRIVTFVSGSGGVGQTSIIEKLAHLLSSAGEKVCVVDAVFSLNDLGLRFGVNKNYDLKDYLSGKVASPIDVLCEVEKNLFVIKSNSVTFDYSRHAELFACAIQEISHDFDFILIDANSFSRRDLAIALAPATEVVCVITDDENNIRNSAKILNKAACFVGSENIKLILNKAKLSLASSGNVLGEAQISNILKKEILFVFPLFYKYNLFSKNHKVVKNKIMFEFLRSFMLNEKNESDYLKAYKGAFGNLKRKLNIKFEW